MRRIKEEGENTIKEEKKGEEEHYEGNNESNKGG